MSVGVCELQHLPFAVGVAHGRRCCAPASSCSTRDRGELRRRRARRAAACRGRAAERARPAASSSVTPIVARRRRQRLQQEARGLRRAVDGDAARPRALRRPRRSRPSGGSSPRSSGRSRNSDERLARDRRRTPSPARARAGGDAGVDVRIDAARLDLARAVLADLGDAQQPRLPAAVERQTTSPGSSASAARRQREAAPARAPPRLSNSQVSAMRVAPARRSSTSGSRPAPTRPLRAGEAARLGDRLAIVAARPTM